MLLKLAINQLIACCHRFFKSSIYLINLLRSNRNLNQTILYLKKQIESECDFQVFSFYRNVVGMHGSMLRAIALSAAAHRNGY